MESCREVTLKGFLRRSCLLTHSLNSQSTQLHFNTIKQYFANQTVSRSPTSCNTTSLRSTTHRPCRSSPATFITENICDSGNVPTTSTFGLHQKSNRVPECTEQYFPRHPLTELGGAVSCIGLEGSFDCNTLPCQGATGVIQLSYRCANLGYLSW